MATNAVSATRFYGAVTGAVTGNASTASHATKVQSTLSNSSTTMYINGTPTLGTASKDLYHSNEFYFTPSNGYLYATRFVGYLQGNISGTAAVASACSGNSASASVASTVSINYNNNSNSTYQMLWGSGNSVYGTAGVYVNPLYNVIYATDMVATSDERLKDRVGPIENALDKVNTLDGFLYTWNDNYTGTDESVQVGVSAQQVEKVLPEAVDELETGYKGVSYGKLVPLLIEAMKELTQENKLIRSELENLKSINT